MPDNFLADILTKKEKERLLSSLENISAELGRIADHLENSHRLHRDELLLTRDRHPTGGAKS